MIELKIELTDDQFEKFEIEAVERGCSINELIVTLADECLSALNQSM